MALHITRRLLKITLLRLGQRASFPRMQEGQGAQCDLSMKLSLWLRNLHWFKVVGLFGIWILESGLWPLDWNLITSTSIKYVTNPKHVLFVWLWGTCGKRPELKRACWLGASCQLPLATSSHLWKSMFRCGQQTPCPIFNGSMPILS